MTDALAWFVRRRIAEDSQRVQEVLAMGTPAYTALRDLRNINARLEVVRMYEAATDAGARGAEAAVLRRVLGLAAGVDREHPDYRPEWTPGA